MSSDLDKLAAEELPTGSFGGPLPSPPVAERPADPLAAEHCAVLLAAVAASSAARRRAHLQFVTSPEQAAS